MASTFPRRIDDYRPRRMMSDEEREQRLIGSELYAELRPLAFSIAYRMLGSVGEAEDVVQEAFLRLHQASGPRYASLADLVAKSRVVLLGNVKGVLVPVVIEAEDPEFPTREFNTVVSVEEVLKGSVPAGDVTVKTLELAFVGPEEWRTPGERVLLFLSPSRETSGLFILANTNYSQTAYLIQGEDVVATVRDPLSEEVAALSLEQFRQAVQGAQ